METTKIITNTKNLVAALEQVEKIINTKSSNYLLRSAFIQAEDGKMKIFANNLEVIGCKTISCIADDKIMFALEDVKRVIKALKYFKGCDTIITFDSDKACNFEDGKKSFKAGITDVNDNDTHSLFAHLGKVWIDNINSNNSNIIEQHTYTIEKLMERYNSISYAIYIKDDLKPILKGINFKANKMVALDGYRIAVSTDTEDNGLSFENEFTINNNTFLILKQFKKGECDIISFKDITVFNLLSEDFILLSRNLEGQYFQWEAVIPCTFSSEFKFEKKNMLENLKYLKEIKVNKEDMNVFAIKTNTLVSPYGSVDIEGLNISETSGYNLTYFTDAIKNLEGDRIKMLHSGALKPIVFKNVEENKYNSQLMLLCPIRLNDGMSTWWK
jgi:DNA polymerase III sliding clamp (beta) subunit (PCNA family)